MLVNSIFQFSGHATDFQLGSNSGIPKHKAFFQAIPLKFLTSAFAHCPVWCIFAISLNADVWLTGTDWNNLLHPFCLWWKRVFQFLLLINSPRAWCYHITGWVFTGCWAEFTLHQTLFFGFRTSGSTFLSDQNIVFQKHFEFLNHPVDSSGHFPIEARSVKSQICSL